MKKSKRRTISSLLVVGWLALAITLALPPSAAFSSDGDFTIILSNPNTSYGSTVTATIAVDVGPNVLGSYDILLKFNSTVLKYSNSTNLVKDPLDPSSPYGSFTQYEITPGQLSMNWFQASYTTEDNVLKGSLSLIEVAFTVLGVPGSFTDLTLEIKALLNPDSGNIGVTQQLIGSVMVNVVNEIDTQIVSQPSNLSNSGAAQFTFSASDPVLKFECQLDAGNYALCTSPKDYPGLYEGNHTFLVRAHNLAGIPDPTPASYAWTIDLTSPVTVSTPAAGTYNASQSVILTTSESATVFYTTDGTDPTENSPAYSGAINIATTTTIKYFSKDTAGNKETVRIGLYIIDATPPTITAFSIPQASDSLDVIITAFTASDNVGITGYMVTESASVPGASDQRWSASAPASYAFDADGVKTLYAWTKDGAGNVSTGMSASVDVNTNPSEPRTGDFTINLSSPSNSTTGMAISATPGSTVKAGIAVNLGSNVLGSYDILLKYNPAVIQYSNSTNLVKDPLDPSSPYGSFTQNEITPGQLSLNWYQASYLANANVLNGNLSLVEVVFTVPGAPGSFSDLTLEVKDLLNPNSMDIGVTQRFIGPVTVNVVTEIDTGIDSHPSNLSNSGAAQFTFSSTDIPLKFECRLDAGNYATCVSPLEYTGLSEGNHTFSVRAYNVAGPDPTPANYSWTIDLTSPVSAATPEAGIYGASQSVALTASETVPIYYTLDGTEPTENSPVYASAINIAATTTLKYFAKDSAGNREGVQTGFYVIDSTAPTVTAFNVPAASNTLTIAITTFTVTDDTGIAGYLVTESANTPAAIDPGWNPLAQTSYTFMAAGTKTLYAWAKDAFEKISAGRSATVNIDTIPPTVNAFSIPATSDSLIVPITLFSATDNADGSGVAGYLLTETSTVPGAAAPGWSASVPKSYKFDTDGEKTLYAWAKDAAGNVSPGRSGTVSITTVTWAITLGGQEDDVASSMQITTDGGYILAGQTWSFGGGWDDAWIIKLDGDGNIQWQNSYGGSGPEHANSIQQTTDGGYIVGGISSDSGFADLWIVKIDGTGNIQWQNTYNNTHRDVVYSIEQTMDGGYIAAGLAWRFGSSRGDAWVLKLDDSGSIQWQKTYGSSEGVAELYYIYSLQLAADSGYIMAGGTHPYGALSNDIWILKLDQDGDIQWQIAYGGSDLNGPGVIQLTNDGGYIVAGWTRSFGAGSTDAWVLKLNGDGNIQWQKTYGGPDSDGANFMQQTSDGGYIMAGWTFYSRAGAPGGGDPGAEDSGAGDTDAWVVKLDESGNIEWQKTYGGLNPDSARSIRETADKGYILTGVTSSFGAGKDDVWVMKIDSNGNISGCTEGFIGISNAIADNSDATINNPNVAVKSTNTLPVTSNASVTNTSVEPATQCVAP